MFDVRQKPIPLAICGLKHVSAGLFLIVSLISWNLPRAGAQEYAVAAVSRHVLTNEGVIALAKAGFDEYFIVERIRMSPSKLDASVQGLVLLKEAGLSEELIREVALQDRRNILAERMAINVFDPHSSAPAAPAGSAKVMAEKHWWGFHWVRVSP